MTRLSSLDRGWEKQPTLTASFATLVSLLFVAVFPLRGELIQNWHSWFRINPDWGYVVYFGAWVFAAFFLLLSGIAMYRQSESDDAAPFTVAWLKRAWPLCVLVVSLVIFLFMVSWSYWVQPETPSERNDFIRTYFTVLGGMFIALQLWLSYLNKEANVATVRLAEDRHINELFYKASDQLGDGSTARRVAGLYSLERIANQSDEFYHQCIEVICAYLRSESRAILSQEPDPKNYAAPEHIAVAWEVLGRRRKVLGAGETNNLNLKGACAIGLTIERGDFCGADLSDSDFRRARLKSCRFSDAQFTSADFDGCSWIDSDFSLCDFSFTDTDKVNPVYLDSPPDFRWNSLMKVTEGTWPDTNFLYERSDSPSYEGGYEPAMNFIGTDGVDTQTMYNVENFVKYMTNRIKKLSGSTKPAPEIEMLDVINSEGE